MSTAGVTVLAPAAFASALDALSKAVTPERLHFEYGPAAGPSPDSIISRLHRDDTPGLVILPVALAQREVAAGRLEAELETVFASTVAFCVRAGTPAPDLTSEAALWQALSSAQSIGISAAGSGTFFRDVLLPKSGQAAALGSKITVFTDRPIGAAVAEGLVDIGFQQKAELLEVAGIDVLDDLAAIARNDTWLALARPKGSATAAEAKALAAMLASARGQGILRSFGLRPVTG